MAGLTVLELGSTVAGPFCGRLLADFGARVIKIEDPGGDVIRSFGESHEGVSLYAASILRNKSVVSVDLRTPAGRDVVRHLAAKVDILIENFRPGTLEKWGLGYDALAAANPGLILVRISGFGQDGPYSGRPGYGIISEAMSGLRSITGDPDRPPARIAMPMTDYLTGLYAAFGAMVALAERGASGRGQVVDAALSESAFSLMESFVPAYDKLGTIPQRLGPRMAGAAPNNLYTTADGEHIHIAAWGQPLFKRLCAAMGTPALADDPRFQDLRIRAGNADALDAIIGAWTGARDLKTVESILEQADVPASKIYTIADIFEDPHFRAREALVQVSEPDLGAVTLAAPVPKLSRTPGAVAHAGRAPGTDTERVLAEFGDYSPQQIAKLLEDGVVHAAARRPDPA
ncbi:CaiB/BaiF CoA transferase family protein [Aquabacter spiritensis]|uniref:CaiB/BaiF CoA transferase family protein n=1 Tax=Aquabacter spiritensis TaxID=933073 RepID=UPI001A9E7EA7|nr:CaiB/BaiF CoA-transferase family protein [Aquabacter spiritensis]